MEDIEKFDKEDFLNSYCNTDENRTYAETSMVELNSIFDDFISIRPALETALQTWLSIIKEIVPVHSVRARIKQPYHLIEKICRKNIRNVK